MKKSRTAHPKGEIDSSTLDRRPSHPDRKTHHIWENVSSQPRSLGKPRAGSDVLGSVSPRHFVRCPWAVISTAPAAPVYFAAMDANALFAKWDGWLTTVHSDVLGLLINRYIFREVQAIIQANPKVQLESSFYEWMGNTYATSQAIGIRRQVDKDRDSVSFARLLSEVAAEAEVISRERHVALYKTALIDLANPGFDRLAGPGAPHLDPVVPTKELAKLEALAAPLRRYANKRIAHFDKSDFKALPTYAELDECLDYLENLLKRYLLLFRAQHYSNIVPVWQYDWKQVFRRPWIE